MKNRIGISSFVLHILAFLFMLLDHMWASIIPGAQWMTMVGRLAFPIFAFMIVEGYYKTGNVRKYLLRLLIFAVISEIPFNYLMSGEAFYPFHQNVLWTFLISLLTIIVIDKLKKCISDICCKSSVDGKLKLRFGDALIIILLAIAAAAICLAAVLIGFVAMVDYYGYGVMTVLIFYFFYGKKWYCYLGQLIAMYLVHVRLFSGLEYTITLFSYTFDISHQGLAVLALIPIWLYNGNQGIYNKTVKWIYYAFYPAHMAILVFIAIYCM